MLEVTKQEQNENEHLALRDASSSADCSIEIKSDRETEEGKLDRD